MSALGLVGAPGHGAGIGEQKIVNSVKAAGQGLAGILRTLLDVEKALDRIGRKSGSLASLGAAGGNYTRHSPAGATAHSPFTNSGATGGGLGGLPGWNGQDYGPSWQGPGRMQAGKTWTGNKIWGTPTKQDDGSMQRMGGAFGRGGLYSQNAGVLGWSAVQGMAAGNQGAMTNDLLMNQFSAMRDTPWNKDYQRTGLPRAFTKAFGASSLGEEDRQGSLSLMRNAGMNATVATKFAESAGRFSSMTGLGVTQSTAIGTQLNSGQNALRMRMFGIETRDPRTGAPRDMGSVIDQIYKVQFGNKKYSNQQMEAAFAGQGGSGSGAYSTFHQMGYSDEDIRSLEQIFKVKSKSGGAAFGSKEFQAAAKAGGLTESGMQSVMDKDKEKQDLRDTTNQGRLKGIETFNSAAQKFYNAVDNFAKISGMGGAMGFAGGALGAMGGTLAGSMLQASMFRGGAGAAAGGAAAGGGVRGALGGAARRLGGRSAAKGGLAAGSRALPVAAAAGAGFLGGSFLGEKVFGESTTGAYKSWRNADHQADLSESRSARQGKLLAAIKAAKAAGIDKDGDTYFANLREIVQNAVHSDASNQDFDSALEELRNYLHEKGVAGHYAHGGVIPGNHGRDDVPIFATPGEVVVPKHVVSEHGGANRLMAMLGFRGQRGGKHFAGGGEVGGWSTSSSDMVTTSAAGLRFTVNKKARNAFEGFIKALVGSGYKPKTVQGYNVRKIANSSKMSNHSYGAAIDIDPGRNPRYGSAKGGKFALPTNVGALAAQFGLNWGGNYRSSKDYMHFEVAGAPSSSGSTSTNVGASTTASTNAVATTSAGAGSGGEDGALWGTRSETSLWGRRSGRSVGAHAESVGNAPTNAKGNVGLAKKMAELRGWGSGSEWDALYWLWNQESGFKTTAGRPGHAYGIPQSNPGNKMSSAGSDWLTNPATQIKWGLGYIANRYGSPSKAVEHKNATRGQYNNAAGWYQKGAWRTKDEDAHLHEGEMVLTAPIADAVRRSLAGGQQIGGKAAGGRGHTCSGAKVEISVVAQNSSDAEARKLARMVKRFIEEDDQMTASLVG